MLEVRKPRDKRDWRDRRDGQRFEVGGLRQEGAGVMSAEFLFPNSPLAPYPVTPMPYPCVPVPRLHHPTFPALFLWEPKGYTGEAIWWRNHRWPDARLSE